MIAGRVVGERRASPAPMSALGQKQTCAPQNVMSALPPKADMCSAKGHVR
jgi:hypothetical protein